MHRELDWIAAQDAGAYAHVKINGIERKEPMAQWRQMIFFWTYASSLSG